MKICIVEIVHNKYLQGLDTGFYLAYVEDNAQDVHQNN